MAKVIILGGCGAVGSVVTKTLGVTTDTFSEVVIADFNETRGREMAAELGDRVSFIKVDATQPQSIKEAVKGADIVMNCVGPFYNTVVTIIGAVIESGINYIDICDDPDVTFDILDMHGKAKEAGITALIGMGGSPGFTNLVAKLISDEFLDRTDAIDIYHTHGGEEFEGPGVIGHRFHCMSIDIPMYLDGELKYVRYFEEDGIALREKFDFPGVGDQIPVFPYPHPEQLTLPNFIKTNRVTNMGSVLPMEYYELTGEVCKIGLASKEPLEVKGQQVVPYDFAVAYLIRERERILKETNFGVRHGGMSVVVKGEKEGKYREYRVHGTSAKQGLGEGTGYPASSAAILMQKGKITSKGVLPPEGCINPREFLNIYKQLAGIEEGDQGEASIIIEVVDENGKVTILDTL